MQPFLVFVAMSVAFILSSEGQGAQKGKITIYFPLWATFARGISGGNMRLSLSPPLSPLLARYMNLVAGARQLRVFV